MDTVLVRATVNALGLRRGDVAEVELGPTADAMIEQGHWIWLNPPAAEPEVVLTDVVKERKSRAKQPSPPVVPVVDEIWEDEGGYWHTNES